MPVPNDPYELVTVPGEEDIQLLAVSRSTSHSHRNESGSKSPWWMVRIDIEGKEVTISNMDGKDDAGVAFKTYAELFAFHIECSRDTDNEITNQLFTSGSLRHEDLIIYIYGADYITDIENAMHNGKTVTEITIVEIGLIKEQWAVFQKIVFNTSRVIKITHDLDRTFVFFRINKKTVTYTSYDQTGKKEGNSSSMIDFSTHAHQIK